MNALGAAGGIILWLGASFLASVTWSALATHFKSKRM